MVSAWGVMTDEQHRVQQRLLQLGVEIITAHGLDGFDGTNARLACVYTGKSRVIAADAVVLVTARSPTDELYKEIVKEITGMTDADSSEVVPTVDKIGDCDAPAIIAAAVYAGHRYARELGPNGITSDFGRQDKLFVAD